MHSCMYTRRAVVGILSAECKEERGLPCKKRKSRGPRLFCFSAFFLRTGKPREKRLNPHLAYLSLSPLSARASFFLSTLSRDVQSVQAAAPFVSLVQLPCHSPAQAFFLFHFARCLHPSKAEKKSKTRRKLRCLFFCPHFSFSKTRPRARENLSSRLATEAYLLSVYAVYMFLSTYTSLGIHLVVRLCCICLGCETSSSFGLSRRVRTPVQQCLLSSIQMANAPYVDTKPWRFQDGYPQLSLSHQSRERCQSRAPTG